MKRVTRAELAAHASEYDCWTAYNGKVYNITQYAAYHPGGKKKLMLGAGKDCTELFDKFHRWVNIGSILSKCVVGVLIDEEPRIEEGNEEDEEEEEESTDHEDTKKRTISREGTMPTINEETFKLPLP